MKGLFDQARAGQTVELAEAKSLVQRLSSVPMDWPSVLLSLIERHTEDNYLYSHSANVCCFSYHLGRCMGYDSDVSTQLGLAGLVQDIGMAGRPEEVATEAGEFTEEDRKIVMEHPAISVERLQQAPELSKEMLEAIKGHHERQQGQGYPNALERRTIPYYAKILAVCDVYDALTHPRSHRKRHSPAQAIKILIDGSQDEFNRRVVKALVDELTLYPKSSPVKLSTDELGVVSEVHRQAPLRPVILVTHDAQQVPLQTPRRVDLLDQPFLYIKELIEELPGIGGSS